MENDADKATRRVCNDSNCLRRMRRTSQLVGPDFSTGRSISQLLVLASVAKSATDFHDVSRAPTDTHFELAQREFTSASQRSSSCRLGKSDLD
jgi:hypothetical protein